eukprot:jgi/Hompol1/1150/HPOL_004469-RA
MTASIVRIACKTQPYEWGKIGHSSMAAQLAAATPGFVPSESTPYAELWMGTHPNAPSLVAGTTTPLKAVLTKDNLAADVHSHYNGDLPFLFKVLSINKALSIQAHPDKTLAKTLFEKSPHLYKDPNHKPEMASLFAAGSAVALTPFEAFIGFRPLQEIAAHLQNYPEFAAVVGDAVAAAFVAQVAKTGTSSNPQDIADNKAALRSLFAALMRQDVAVIAKQLQTLIARIAASSNVLDLLIVRLNSQFPDDVGCFCTFLLNYVTLKSGEAIYLAANEPHAYLSGDIVECMATSDNVVRSGLTPKFKDVDTLVSMLTYNYGPADAQILRGERFNSMPSSTLYNPPIDEFAVALIRLSAAHAAASVEKADPIKGPSIAIVTEGAGTISSHGQDNVVCDAPRGAIFFIAADTPVTFKVAEGAESFVVYRAFCQL